MSNLVTTPKLFEPPFNALYKSEFSLELALINWPEARAIYGQAISIH